MLLLLSILENAKTNLHQALGQCIKRLLHLTLQT